MRWVHRSSFVIRPPPKGYSRSPSQVQHGPNRTPPHGAPSRIPIPDTNLFVDPGWYGTIVVETEGTNESLADLQDRCGPGAFPPRATRVNGHKPSAMDRENKLVFRILREKRYVSLTLVTSSLKPDICSIVDQAKSGSGLSLRKNVSYESRTWFFFPVPIA